MAVLDHLRELRRRLIIMVLIVGVRRGARAGSSTIPILHFLEHPYCSVPTKHRFHGTNDEASASSSTTACWTDSPTRLKVSVIAGAVFTGPFWLYQIWAFITPGLRKNERKYTIIFIVASTVLFVAGHGARLRRAGQGPEHPDHAGRRRHAGAADDQRVPVLRHADARRVRRGVRAAAARRDGQPRRRAAGAVAAEEVAAHRHLPDLPVRRGGHAEHRPVHDVRDGAADGASCSRAPCCSRSCTTGARRAARPPSAQVEHLDDDVPSESTPIPQRIRATTDDWDDTT